MKGEADWKSAVHFSLENGLIRESGSQVRPLRARKVDSHFLAKLGNEDSLSCPLFFQRQVQRSRDVRITVVGRNFFVAEISVGSFEGIDSRTAWANGEYSRGIIDDRLKAMIEHYLRCFGLNYGAFDFIRDPQGVLWFLECNPSGQYLWIERELDLPITACLASHLAGHDPPLCP